MSQGASDRGRWMMRGRLALGICAFPLWPLASRLSPAVHDTHVSLTRMVVEDSAITARVRMFRDDLENALARFHGTDSATVANHPGQDSLIGAYLGQKLVLEAEGKALPGRVLQMGRERDEGNWEMTWVLVRYPLLRPVKHVVVRNDIMFELFPNQQNLVQAMRVPGGERQTLYYAVGSEPQALDW